MYMMSLEDGLLQSLRAQVESTLAGAQVAFKEAFQQAESSEFPSQFRHL